MWLFLIIILLIFPPLVKADVIINEVYPNPNTGEQEWVELTNNGPETVALINWQLWDQQSSPSNIHQFTTETISPDEYLVIELQSVLNNGGDAVIIKNDLGEVIDQLAYDSSTKGKSWSKDGKLVVLAEPTQGKENLIPVLTPTPTNESPPPALSEIMACPDDGAEWVELYNPHRETVYLFGFSLHDNKNQLLTFDSQSLAAGEYLAVELQNVLNNGGDSVSLISPSHQVIDQFSYQKCSSDQSWVNHDGVWEQTTVITKNLANVFPQGEVLGTTTATSSATTIAKADSNGFLYPPSILQPKLSYRDNNYPARENIVFSDPPHLEQGALSVIIGGCLLLIPGYLYVKKNQQNF